MEGERDGGSERESDGGRERDEGRESEMEGGTLSGQLHSIKMEDGGWKHISVTEHLMEGAGQRRRRRGINRRDGGLDETNNNPKKR